MRRVVGGVALFAIVLAACGPGSSRTAPFGFTTGSARTELALEQQFLSKIPDSSSIRSFHRFLTSSPHPAGSSRDRELAEWTARQFSDAGLHDVRITTHEVMLPRPLEVSVEMTHPRPWHASMREDPIPSDPDTRIDQAAAGPPYHAYSASGDVTAPVLYAGAGEPAQYDWLAAQGIDVRGCIVLVRYSAPYSYRGFKALTAQQRGAVGILMFSDPADDGSMRGKPYPDGPWGPDSRIQRGGIIYDHIVPGDPLTPGWASVPGAPRVAREEAASLPKIVSVPISANDARPILESLGGPPAPEAWKGGLPVQYRVGPGRERVRLKVRMDDSVRPVWTVTGMLHGTASPDRVVIVGNHRDAWLYGGVDPSSGSAALVALARGLGALAHDGWRPKRSILFASWDAEEFAMTSSTEWGEQHERWLRDSAIAYLNVDSAASGPHFVAGAVPSLMRVLAEVAGVVRDPLAGVPISTITRDRMSIQSGIAADGTEAGVIHEWVGGGSDTTVFLNYLGIPVADLGFDGPYGVYHSVYDTHEWVSRFGDPGFRYHEALVKLWGLAALRLAQADTLPLDPEATARRIPQYLSTFDSTFMRMATPVHLSDLRAAADELRTAAAAFNEARQTALERRDLAAIGQINERLLVFERAFTDPEGLPGRRWYRHLVHAPRATYLPEMLPGLKAAFEEKDHRAVEREAARLAAALRRAAARLRGG